MQPRQKRLLQQVGVVLLLLAGLLYFRASQNVLPASYTGAKQALSGAKEALGGAKEALAGAKEHEQTPAHGQGQGQGQPAQAQIHTPQEGALAGAPVVPSTGGSRQYFFVFGDSYSSHSHFGFNPNEPLTPTDENPLGYLPPTPGQNQGTFSGGDIWIDHVVRKARPGTHVYSYAVAGNVVNATKMGTVFDPLLLGIHSTVTDMVVQVGHFETIHDKTVPWTGQNSVFFNFFGVNDLTATQLHSNLTQEGMDGLIQATVDDFWTLVRQQYAHGARRFIHMNVPPMNRIPSYVEGFPEHKPRAAHLTAVWTAAFRAASKVFSQTHTDASSLVFETADVFNDAMDHFADYGARSASCFTFAEDDCLWYDFLHPGQVIHRKMGEGIAELAQKLPGQI